jgi:hypothetical protein
MFNPLTQPACVTRTNVPRTQSLHTARSGQPLLAAISFVFTDKLMLSGGED